MSGKTFIIYEFGHYILQLVSLFFFAFLAPIGFGLVKHGKDWEKVYGAICWGCAIFCLGYTIATLMTGMKVQPILD